VTNKFVKFTEGSRAKPTPVYLNRARVILVRPNGSGATLLCNDGEKVNVFESQKDVADALNAEDE
jgi:ATP-dependent protease Clp ATPase subunit